MPTPNTSGPALANRGSRMPKPSRKLVSAEGIPGGWTWSHSPFQHELDHMHKLLALLLILCAGPVMAESDFTFEVTPFAGYRMGG